MPVLKTDGVLECGSADAMRGEGLEWIRRHNLSRCLLDLRTRNAMKLTTMDIFDLPDLYRQAGIDRSFRMAVLRPPGRQDDLEFHETVCHNRGDLVRLFQDEEEALARLA